MLAEGQSTDTSSWGNKVRMGTLALMTALAPSATTTTITLGGTGLVATMTSCGDKDKDPNPEEITLTAEEQAFADKLAPHPDGTLKYSILEGGVDPYIFKNFAKINLELLSAKGMLYKATPVIQKKSVADVLAKAKELNPTRPRYWVSLSLVKKSGSNETVLNATEFIADKDDNNPSTPDPWLDLLPEEFTMDEFKKYNPFSTTPKSYNLNAGEDLIVRIYIGGGGPITNFNFGVNPTQKVN
ncbi:MAG: hypothetical protein IPQ23_18355 [Cytophagaceae bacterium]|nr:hypothetical protein [Cytophagaceae bacterium]